MPVDYNDAIVWSVGGTGVTMTPSGQVLVGLSSPTDRDGLTRLPLPDDFRSNPSLRFLDGHLSNQATAAFLDATTAISVDSLDNLLSDPTYDFACPAYEIGGRPGVIYSPVPDVVVVGFGATPTPAVHSEVVALAKAHGFSTGPSDSPTEDPDRLPSTIRFSTRASRDRPSGQPEAAIKLRDALMAPGVGVEYAELDWFAINPQQDGSSPQDNLTALGIDTTGAFAGFETPPIAFIDGGFEKAHPALTWSGAGFDAVQGDADKVWDTTDPHGTAVAGIAISTPTADGPMGIVRGTKGLPVRAYQASEETVLAESSHLAKAIDVSVHKNARVINISLAGYVPTRVLWAAVRNAEEHRVVVVAGSGNLYKESTDKLPEPPEARCAVQYPAAFPQVVAVGAVTRALEVAYERVGWQETENPGPAWASCYGDELDVVAPGRSVWTTDPVGQAGYAAGPFTTDFAGTSAAAPHVTAIAALVFAKHPDWTAAQVREAIYSSCRISTRYPTSPTKVGTLELQRSDEVGFGLPDIKKLPLGEDSAARDPEGDQGMDPAQGERSSEPGASSTNTSTPDSEIREKDSNMSNGFVPCADRIDDYTDKAYRNAFDGCLRPLSEFMNALVLADDAWPQFLNDFWKNPYKTARIAGLPWQACIVLAEGDTDRIKYLISIELMRDEGAQQAYSGAGAGGGPVGVKAR